MAPDQLVLPNGVVTRADVGRLATEAEAADTTLNEAVIRGGSTTERPKLSQLLDETFAINKLDILQPEHRKQLVVFLQTARTQAPTLHISFNVDPSPTFQKNLVTWIRKEVDPSMLLHIGLHPAIGAGCVVRTTNKFFDFSLRQRFADKRTVLIEKLRGDNPAPAAAPAVHTAEPVHAQSSAPVSPGGVA